MAGYKLAKVQTDARGNVDVAHLRELVTSDRRADAHGPVDARALRRAHRGDREDFHEVGALLYGDGANLNAVCGIARPGRHGLRRHAHQPAQDLLQPHGGGGPGGGPVAVRDKLEPFLPVPAVVKDGERFGLDYDCPQSIGRVAASPGPFGVFVRSYAYIRYTAGACAMSRPLS